MLGLKYFGKFRLAGLSMIYTSVLLVLAPSFSTAGSCYSPGEEVHGVGGKVVGQSSTLQKLPVQNDSEDSISIVSLLEWKRIRGWWHIHVSSGSKWRPQEPLAWSSHEQLALELVVYGTVLRWRLRRESLCVYRRPRYAEVPMQGRHGR